MTWSWVHRAGVTGDLDQPGTYARLPVRPLKEYLRNTAVFRMLGELRQRLLDLERISRYHGGDFAGLTAKLDYIKGLGATAIWVTPFPQQAPAGGHSRLPRLLDSRFPAR